MFVTKFALWAMCVLTARAGLIGAPVVEVHHPPHYSFAYDVKDTLTGDFKGQVESRVGDVVRGQYNVLDPDGTRRIVDYFADPVHGFNAVVRKAPAAVAVAPPPPPLVAAAPVARAFVPAPLARVAPVGGVFGPALVARSAPVLAAAPVARFAPFVAPAPVARVVHPVLPRPTLALVG